MTKIKLRNLFIAFTVFAFSACSGGGSTAVPTTPHIAVLGALSGDNADSALLEMKKGLELVVDGISGLDVVGYDTGGSLATLSELYYGRTATDLQTGITGIYDNSDVVATIVVNSSEANIISANSDKEAMFKIGVLSTATTLEGRTNLLLLPPSNDIQADAIYSKVKADATAASANKSFALITQTNSSVNSYSLDLYFRFAGRISTEETAMLDSDGKDSLGADAYYAQMVTGLMIYRDSNDTPVVPGSSLAALNGSIDQIVYLGFDDDFAAVFAEAQTQGLTNVKWYASDAVVYPTTLELSGIEDADFTVVSIGGRDTSLAAAETFATDFTAEYGTAPDIFSDYGYDAGKFISAIVDAINTAGGTIGRGDFITYSADISYVGITGTKSMTATEPGWYDYYTVSNGAWSVTGTTRQ